MTRTALPLAIMTLTLAMSAAVAAAGTIERTFVSAAGSDSNSCASVTAPCRHFTAAYTATAPGGSIVALDPANYGSLTIQQAISIDGQGWAFVTPVSGSAGIMVSANPGDDVVLRGLVIDGAGAGTTNGIAFTSGNSLTVEGSTVRNVTNNGLNFTPNAAATLAVSDSSFHHTGNFGIYFGVGGTGPWTASVERTALNNNTVGGLEAENFASSGNLEVSVTDSVASNNGRFGFTAVAVDNSIDLVLTHCRATNNLDHGLFINSPNTTIWLAQSTVAGNAASFFVGNGGAIKSYGDNYIPDSGATGGLTQVGKQ